MRIVCQQIILMKYHALLVIFEKAAKFEIVICRKLQVAFYGLSYALLVLLLLLSVLKSDKVWCTKEMLLFLAVHIVFEYCDKLI